MNQRASSPASRSAVEEVSLDDPMPFDRNDDRPEPAHPEFVWVRAPAPKDTVVYRRFFAPEAPANGLEYLPDEGADPRPSGPIAVVPSPAPMPRARSAERPVKLNVIRLDVSEDEAYVDQKSGILDRKIYVRLAKLGRFPTFKVGQSFLAKRADVLAYLASEAEAAKPKVKAPDEVAQDLDLDELRKKVGLVPRRRR
jgi:hypothetical protein